MSECSPADRLEKLLIELLDGDMSAPRSRELTELLRRDAEARARYLRFLWLHAELIVGHVRTPSLPPLSTSPDDGLLAPPALPGSETGLGKSPPVFGFLGETGRRGWNFFCDHPLLFSLLVVAVLGLAGSLAGRGIFGSRPAELAHAPAVADAPATSSSKGDSPIFADHGFAAVPGKSGQSPANPQSPIPNPSPVARLVRTSDCRWTSASAALAAGRTLTAGQQIDIVKGEVEIAFAHGATMVLRGPGTLTVQSGKSAKLLFGRAMVSAQRAPANGFRISTSKTALVGSGADFEVQTHLDGRSEVFVTAGAVDIRSSAADTRRLEAGQGAQIEPGEPGVCALIANGDDMSALKKSRTIEPPTTNAYLNAQQDGAVVCIGRRGPSGSEAGRPNEFQIKVASPDSVTMLADDPYTSKVLLDLSQKTRVVKFNTYSWNRDGAAGAHGDRRRLRAPQRYMLYGFSGDHRPPTAGDPLENGWTFIGGVDTDTFFARTPLGNEQTHQAVSITSARGELGRWRYLLWHVWPVDAGAASGGPAAGNNAVRSVFIREIDVYVEEEREASRD